LQNITLGTLAHFTLRFLGQKITLRLSFRTRSWS